MESIIKIHYLYWIHLKEHENILEQGYVGVTSVGVEKRFTMHKKSFNKKDNKRGSVALMNAFEKYGIENLILSTLCVGSQDYIYDLENKLRPKERIGWNIKTGGIQSPSLDQCVKDKISKSNSGKKRTKEMNNRMSNRLTGRKVKFHKRPSMVPWKARKRTEKSIACWFDADVFYLRWLELDKPKFVKFCSLLKIEHKHPFRNMIEKFSNGWIPTEDPVWIEFKNV